VLRVAVVGCGVVGAAIAYELSQVSGLTVDVLERSAPASASTGAALGVLMGVISHKVKGRNWRLRRQSLERYPCLLAELEAATGQPVPHNRQGIVSLCFRPDSLPRWYSLQKIRQRQGYPLKIWSPQRLATACPHLNLDDVVAGIYSPADIQVDPSALTQALVRAAQQRGVTFHWPQPVTHFETVPAAAQAHCTHLHTATGTIPTDLLVLATGLGTLPLTQASPAPVPIGAVLGQALRIRLPQPLGDPDFQPVITGHDIHLVPLGAGEYWVGATVEFPPDAAPPAFIPTADAERLVALRQRAISYCPALAQAEVLDQWSGLRPRPAGQAAPVIQPLAGYDNVWLATGHYRNGVLLAPATALHMRTVVEALG